jgi:choice-of-anchor B domain-containing protein
MKKVQILFIFLVNFSFGQICTGGFAGIYPCNNIDLQARLSFLQMGGTAATEGNDCWGWTDPLTNKEYAIMGCTSHTAFVDISNPTTPFYVGKVVSTNNVSSLWRSVKVYNNYAFIVSEAAGHGMQIFDLTRLRNVTTPQTFTVDALYTGFGSCHNVAINEATGFAYCVGSSTFAGGPHVVNIQSPLNPVFSFGYSNRGYTHDAQIVIYNGPDTQHVGKEIYFGANEDEVVIVDVTNKNNPILLSTFTYANRGYTHQGWLTSNQKYWILGDELDETNFGFNTKSIIIDLSNLDAPVLKGNYFGVTPAIDHNGYIVDNDFYLANYRAGLRIMNISNIETSSTMNEIGFFDTFPTSNSAQFNGAWSNYPFFASGNILISDIERGLFIVKKNAALSFQEFEKDSFKISPNPSADFTAINSQFEIEQIEIFDIVGKKIKEFNNLSTNDFTIALDEFISGIYFVKVNNATTLKLIVK